MTRTTGKWILFGLGGALGLAALVVFLPGIVWRVAGWVLLGFLGLVVLLMVVPVTIKVEFEAGQLMVWVRVLFLRLRVWPMKPGKPKKEKPEKKKDAEEEKAPAEEKKEKKKRSFGETVTLVKRLAAAGMAAVKRFLRHLRITGVELVLPVHAEEASDTALRCGQIQATLGVADSLLRERLHIRWRRLLLIPDFAGQHKKELRFACKVMFCPGIIVPMGYAFLKKYRSYKRPYSKAAYKRAIAEKQAARQQAAAAQQKKAG